MSCGWQVTSSIVGQIRSRFCVSYESLGRKRASFSGNHDLHFLAIVFGGHSAGAKDTLGKLLAADDAEELAHWLRRQKLLHSDYGHTMVPLAYHPSGISITRKPTRRKWKR